MLVAEKCRRLFSAPGDFVYFRSVPTDDIFEGNISGKKSGNLVRSDCNVVIVAD